MEIRAQVQGFFSVSDIIPPVTADEYRGYIIGAWARPEFANGYSSVSVVYARNKVGSIIQVQRIEGELFDSKERAERHALDLCKEWIDNQSEFSDKNSQVA
jgi:hypothetical protein